MILLPTICFQDLATRQRRPALLCHPVPTSETYWERRGFEMFRTAEAGKTLATVAGAVKKKVRARGHFPGDPDSDWFLSR